MYKLQYNILIFTMTLDSQNKSQSQQDALAFPHVRVKQSRRSYIPSNSSFHRHC